MSDMSSSVVEGSSLTRMVRGARSSSRSGEVDAQPGVAGPVWGAAVGAGTGVAAAVWGTEGGRRGPSYL